MDTHTHESHPTQDDYLVMSGIHDFLVTLIPRP